MYHLAIIFVIIPISILLTISYFVLRSSESSASEGLKKFAKAVALLLWISSGVLLTGAIFRTLHPGGMMMGGFHHMGHGGMQCQMKEGGMNCSMKGEGKNCHSEGNATLKEVAPAPTK